MTTRPHDRDAGPLPDLLGLSLTELRGLDHPVLSAVLEELRGRVLGDGAGQFYQFNQNLGDDLVPADPSTVG
ncbi:FxSxx-COOH cyclophane-containing RiPP peptide [Streptomyces sp. URMC 129]|uniref:FxSxx-COOH cyclophane-containing RiPP peptide n=1 Tax=Streptomyces sp. URMC 129 TaxID=3423407 RepID=UPI003F1DACD2